MEVFLKNIEIDVPDHAFVACCKNPEDYASLISEIGNRLCEMDDEARRLLLRGVIPDMSINGRRFIEYMYGAIAHWDESNKPLEMARGEVKREGNKVYV